MLSHAETQQLQALRKDLQALQASGVVFPVDSWPAKLLRPEPRCHPPRVAGCSCCYSEPVCFAQSSYTGRKKDEFSCASDLWVKQGCVTADVRGIRRQAEEMLYCVQCGICLPSMPLLEGTECEIQRRGRQVSGGAGEH